MIKLLYQHQGSQSTGAGWLTILACFTASVLSLLLAWATGFFGIAVIGSLSTQKTQDICLIFSVCIASIGCYISLGRISHLRSRKAVQILGLVANGSMLLLLLYIFLHRPIQ